ncbi:translocation protein SEC63 homolog isoform X2 [Anopheles bellator]|uniref:translocation protein SEC63 homolog isoform X2 n=1 Tax=Anopheles bellator TaxID=139047 RepID=UPI00264978BF|nr:translocation protein SEC63 homolog isoform X2 [Anopheles bellator]
MGGQKFQYDESGGTFFYFILSFLALILIPATFYFWPRKKKEDPDLKRENCNCEPCLKKRATMEHSDPYKGFKELLIKLSLVAGWALLAFLTYKVSQFDYEMSNFDPYEILGVPLGSSQKDIKKAYRTLSVILHPDKETGDEKAFMKLTKAYQALTDDEARKNWEKYGNPDGPGATSFGIALPSWIVEKENSIWVLGLYGLVFMVALPIVVGTWWYRSIRYSGDKVLLDTTNMYWYFFHKTPQMAVKRVIMILAASFEFDKRQNNQVIERQSDNDEVPALIRQLPNLNEKCKELPFSRLYSLKARAILHAHLSRIPLKANTLEIDRQLIVRKCPYLIQEMVSCVSHLIMLAYARKIQRVPKIETIENCMKLSPMVMQGLWEFKHPILQLPHLTEEIRQYMLRKFNVRNLQQLAQLKPDQSRAALRSLSDEQYANVVKVLGRMPLIDFNMKCEVVDDENSNVVTAGAIVTVTVELVRRSMSELFGDATAKEKQGIAESNENGDGEGDADGELEVTDEKQDPKQTKKQPVWQPKPGKGPYKGKSKGAQKNRRIAAAVAAAAAAAAAATAAVAQTQASKGSHAGDKEKGGGDRKAAGPDEMESDAESGAESDNDASDAAADDDDEWEKFQQKINKREKLEGRSKVSHPVHCPLFPEEKHEYWWTYICDRKSRTMLTVPYHVTNLIHREEVQLKFTAPRWAGVYVFTVCLRSDSYFGMDQQLELKLDVKDPAAIPTEHPQWDISESESDHNVMQANDSEFTTDSSDGEDEGTTKKME